MSEEIRGWIGDVVGGDRRDVHRQPSTPRSGTSRRCSRPCKDLSGAEVTADELREEVDLNSTEDLVEYLVAAAQVEYDEKEQELGSELMRELERYVTLQVVDTRWREHLENMDYLREGVHLRAFAQKDPLVEYRGEGHKMFEELGLRSARRSSARSSTRSSRLRTPTRSPSNSRRRSTAAGSRTSTSRSRAPARSPARQRAAVRSRRRARWRRRRPSPRSRSCARTSRRSAATTRAGAARARSTRSVTVSDRESGSRCAAAMMIRGHRGLRRRL